MFADKYVQTRSKHKFNPFLTLQGGDYLPSMRRVCSNVLIIVRRQNTFIFSTLRSRATVITAQKEVSNHVFMFLA